jgi:hypothetical protein
MVNWRKSSYSDANGGQCVEVASEDAILVRDTANRAGPVLSVPAQAWQRFADTLR